MIRVLSTTLFCLTLAAALTAQSGAPPASQQEQQPTFRARVDSILVDVSVTDRQGRPVTDLKLEDFEIRESNRVQKVDSFRLIEADVLADASALRDRQILSMGDQQRETSDPENRLYVIFMDDYHVRRGNGIRIREQLAAFVRQLTARDLVAVLYPMTPIAAATFTRNHDGTADAILRFEGRKYDYTPKNEYERQYAYLLPETLEEMRNELTMRALRSACVYLGSLREGRKAILFVSEGMTASLPRGARTTGSFAPATGTDPRSSQAFFANASLLNRMQDIFMAASRSNTSVFTLDPRGLATSEFGMESNVDFESDRQVLQEATDSLRIIADETDGRAMVGKNNPVPDLQKMVREMSSYYLLGYTSTLAPRDGKFHPIQVRVNRRDVEVKARKGYWAYTEDEVRAASAPPKAGPPAEIADALDELAASVEPAARRPVTVWIGSARSGSEMARVTLAWEAAVVPGQDAFDRVAQITLTATAGTGDVLFEGPVKPDPATGRVAGRADFDSPPGLVRLRIVSQNANGQRIETDDSTYDVPDFTSAQAAISTPVLFRGRTARDFVQLRAAAAPLPSVSRQFSRTERLLLRFDAYGPGGTTPKPAMRLLNKVGEPIIGLPDPVLVSGTTFEVELGLGALPPSEYLIEIAVAGADETLRKLIGIRVTG